MRKKSRNSRKQSKPLAWKTFALLKQIPRGKVATYSQIANSVGTHPRAVASILRGNKDPERIPCYKVVMSDGRLGGYSGPGGVNEKARRLRADGIWIKNGKVAAECMLHGLRKLQS